MMSCYFYKLKQRPYHQKWPIENHFSKSMITFETFKFKYFLKSSKILNFSSFSIIWSGWTFSNFQPSFSILIFERFFEPLSLWVEINSGRLSLTTHLLPFVFSQFLNSNALKSLYKEFKEQIGQIRDENEKFQQTIRHRNSLLLLYYFIKCII